ncbi:chain length determinant protein EpsF [Massilia sp. LXY-6]|uniref:chain length determinant protein EpsF n=1 Tax=Massilia sp. LXY-6 TaxID=3379823 RepID=UPI003EDE9B85
MNPAQLLAVLKGRRREAQFVFAAFAAGIFATAFMLPVQYTAGASVVLNLKSADGLSSIALPGGLVSTHIATQINIVQSDRVLQKAVDALGLAKRPEWQRKWQASALGKKAFQVWAGETLGNKLVVKPVPDSSVLTVSYTSSDPAFAAEVANAVVHAYMATGLEMRLEPARQYSHYFEQRAALLRVSLEQARAKLLDYQRSNNLIITDEKINLEADRLHELSSKLTDAKVAASESSAHRRRAAGTPDSAKEALGDPVVAALSEEASRQEANFAEQSMRLGANHPQVVELAARIAALKQRRDAAIRKTLGSLDVADKVNQTQLQDLEKDLSAQRTHVLDLEARRVEAGLLEREIANTQRAYDAVLEKASQAELQSGDNQSEISILGTASLPLDRPLIRLLKYLGLACGGAALAALAFVLVRERFDRRIRTADDITADLGQHLLATLQPPAGARPGAHPLFSLSRAKAEASSSGSAELKGAVPK